VPASDYYVSKFVGMGSDREVVALYVSEKISMFRIRSESELDRDVG
jgi:hypothetical protein